MASSPIEIASSHFGCVLRDHNQRIIRERNIDREREGSEAAAAALRKNLEEFVRDNFPACIALPTTSLENVSSDENSLPGSEDIHQRDYWGFNEGRRNNQNFRPILTNANRRRQQETVSTESSPTTRTWQSGRIFGRWAAHQAGDDDMVNSNERRKQINEAENQTLSNCHPASARSSTFMRETSPSASDSSVDVPKLRASSLVQMWKELEAETTVPTGNNQSQSAAGARGGGVCSSLNSDSAISTTGRNSSNPTNNINVEDSYVEEPSSDSNDEADEAVVVVNEDSYADWLPDRMVASCSLSTSQGQFSDTTDSERVVRVADIIRRLTSGSQPQSPAASVTDEVDRDQSVMTESLSREHSLSDQSVGSGNISRVNQLLSDQSVTGGNTPRVNQLLPDQSVTGGNTPRVNQLVQDQSLAGGNTPRVNQLLPDQSVTGGNTPRVNQLVQDQSVAGGNTPRVNQLLLDQSVTRGNTPRVNQLLLDQPVTGGNTPRVNQLMLDQSVTGGNTPRVNQLLLDQPVTGGNTPRVRGRQALKDLLMQMERERQRELTGLVERHAVSKFSHRGRIQSLLKLKFMQRGAAAEGQQKSALSELNPPQRRTTIFRLRESFSPSVERDGTTVLSRVDEGRSPRQLSNDTPDSVQSVLLNLEVHPHQEDIATLEQKYPQEENTMQTINEQLHREASQSSDVTLEGPRSEVAQNNWREPVNGTDSSHHWEGEVVTGEEQAQQPVGGSSDSWEGVYNNNRRKPEIATSSSHDWEGEVITTRQHVGGSTDVLEGVSQPDWQVPATTAARSREWEGEVMTAEEPLQDIGDHVGESMDMGEGASVTEEPEHPNINQFVEPACGTQQDNIYRPQSDWEGRRKAWYNDMLENNSDNDEIRALFDRRTVSTFLSSERRERMDQMIFSFVRRQRYETNTENNEEEGHQENRIGENHYTEVSDDTDQVAYTSLQLPLPSQLRSLNQYEYNQVSDVSDQVASTLFHIPQSFQSDNEDSRQSSPFPRQSLEMELIYDLRGYMAQLHHEMTELRKSVQSCMGMQVKLQNSIKEEVSAAVCNSILGGETKEFFNRQNSWRKNNCRICFEKQVDSLLYRCGHMCTCFKCAQELQLSSSSCPICQAPILDVVRTYADT